MKQLHKALLLTVISFFIAGHYAANAQGPGGFGGGGYGGGAGGALRVTGTVAAVDTTNNLITIAGRGQDAVPTTVKFNNDTKYTKLAPVPLTSIKVGDAIEVGSATPPQPGDTTIAANRITELAALPQAPPAGAGGGGFGGGAGGNGGGGFGGRRGGGGRGLAGTVATITPTLTITTVAGATVTVTTDPTTEIMANQPATIADINAGTNVTITTKTDSNATLIATTVAVTPARQRRPGAGQ